MVKKYDWYPGDDVKVTPKRRTPKAPSSEAALSQAESSSSSQADSEERESSASSNSSLVFFALPAHTRSTVSQSRESTKSTLSAPAPRSTSRASRLMPSPTRPSRRRPPRRELDPKSSSPRTLQRAPPPTPERSSRRRSTVPSPRP